MIAALFAVDEAGGMGHDGIMPWPRNKDDMRWFKRTTQNQIVVMGRNTWDSGDMPTPLPGRHNVLITNNFINRSDITQIKGNICKALLELNQKNVDLDIYVIGGPHILIQCLPIIERAFITQMPGEYICDTNLDLSRFLNGFILNSITDLGSCTIEEYVNNEAIS